MKLFSKHRLFYFFSLIFFLSVIINSPWAQAAEDFPKRPIKIYIGFPPGGSTDAPMRILA